MEIVLATGNLHKLEELQKILPNHTLLLPDDVIPKNSGITFYHDETAPTFIGNSMGKAETLYKLCRRPVIADDSGLVVPALNGEPGVLSARYGSTEIDVKLSDADRNAFLLQNMRGIENREAFFVCCMTLMLDEYRVFTIQETFPGIITEQPSGHGGFGYDPLFYLPELGKTAAELQDIEKNAISHRGRAGQRLAALLDSLN